MKWDIIQIRISEATRIYKCYKGFFRGSGLLVVRQDVEQLAMAYLKSAPSLGCSDVEDSDDDSWRQQIGRQSRSGRLVGKHFLPKKFWCTFISFHGDVPPFPPAKISASFALETRAIQFSWLFSGQLWFHTGTCVGTGKWQIEAGEAVWTWGV